MAKRKKPSKYHKKFKINATFEEALKILVSAPPKKKAKKKTATKKKTE